MANEREYIVTLRDKDDATDFLTQMTATSAAVPTVPDRAVTVVDELPHSLRNTHYALTDEEAETLRNDPRVLAVELTPTERGFSKIHHAITSNQIFQRDNTSINNTMRNWGLARHSSHTNFSGNVLLEDYNYSFDGTGVDIVFIDSGIFPGHPEWSSTYDGTGPSRLQQVNWYDLTGIEGSQAPAGGYYMDVEGHGSNCASLAAGSQHGFAKGAHIYSIRIFDGIVGGTYYGAISDTVAFDMVRVFHENKPVVNGIKRPTICSNSWGYGIGYPTGSFTTTYRGVAHTQIGRNASYGQVYPNHGVRVPSVDAAVQDCVNAGVIMVGAAGNDYHKSDVSTGTDFNNKWNDGAGSGDIYYHQGGSPCNADAGMIVVGALDATSTEQKATFSTTGPGVDIYAAGVMTMGAWSNTSYVLSAVPDSRNPLFYLNKLSGSSMATPQVAGMLAVMAQVRPKYTPAQLKSWLMELSDKSTMTEGGNSYTNYRSLQGGVQRVATIAKYANPNPVVITSNSPSYPIFNHGTNLVLRS